MVNLDAIGLKMNPYEPFVENKMENGIKIHHHVVSGLFKTS